MLSVFFLLSPQYLLKANLTFMFLYLLLSYLIFLKELHIETWQISSISLSILAKFSFFSFCFFFIEKLLNNSHYFCLTPNNFPWSLLLSQTDSVFFIFLISYLKTVELQIQFASLPLWPPLVFKLFAIAILCKVFF